MRAFRWLAGAEEIGFKVVFKSGVEFLFFTAEELEVSAVLGIF